jgi:hypothetical protein
VLSAEIALLTGPGYAIGGASGQAPVNGKEVGTGVVERDVESREADRDGEERRAGILTGAIVMSALASMGDGRGAGMGVT